MYIMWFILVQKLKCLIKYQYKQKEKKNTAPNTGQAYIKIFMNKYNQY